MAQRNNSGSNDRNTETQSAQRSGYGYQQDMPQRNDYGGHRGRNEFDQNRQYRGMNQQEWQDYQQPQHYRMDFDRNRQSYDRGERGGRSFGYRGNSVYDRDNSSTAEDMGYRSASSDMPSADRYRTRGFDDDGPGLYGGAEDYGHAGFQERFDYGANRYPNPQSNRGQSYDGGSRNADGGTGAAWSYDRAEQWNREGNRNGSSNYNSGNYSSTNSGGASAYGNSYSSSGSYGSSSDRGSNPSSGPHRGKGPKNYSRSDDRIQEDVCERLMHDGEVDASEIEVKVSSGEVTLTGTVNSKDEKRRAEDCIENLSGIKDVHNELRVEASKNSHTGSSATSSTSNNENSTNGQSTRSNTRSTARVS